MTQKLLIAKTWDSFNVTDTWWDKHDSVPLHDVEKVICPDLHFLKITSDPTYNNIYSESSMMDGAQYESSSYAKTQVKLNFHLHYIDDEDFMRKKHDIQRYFSPKASFHVASPYRPALMAVLYVNAVPIDKTTDHDTLFTVTMDNPHGMWYSNPTSNLVNNWNPSIATDLEFDIDAAKGGKSPNWYLHPGMNKIYIAGDALIQMTNPIVDCSVKVKEPRNFVSVINHTNKTSLSFDSESVPDNSMTWHGLDLRDDSNNQPLNQFTNETDFWLSPGWNQIELVGANEGFIDTRFYYTNY